MSSAVATAPPSEPKAKADGPRIRIAHRSSAGELDMDWPAERIAEALADAGATLWVDIEHPEADLAGVERLMRDTFHFHPLAIEDALRESHVPKVDDWCGYLYLVVHGIDFDPETDHLRLHELDLFLGKNYLVSCHAEPMRPIETLRRQVETDPERAARGPDHLLYHLLDMGSDEYLAAIEHLDEAIDAAQEEVFDKPTPDTLQQIFRVKRSAVKLQRILGPQREVLNKLARDTYAQIDAPDRVYFRDVYDHQVRLHDLGEGLRDLVNGALDTYLSVVSNRTNEIMKTLTIATVMFLPLNFVTGFFGMNFFGDNIHLHYGLAGTALFWGGSALMALAPLGLWYWAHRRGWS